MFGDMTASKHFQIWWMLENVAGREVCGEPSQLSSSKTVL